MTSGFGGPDGWDGSSLHVFVDGIEVAAETMLNNGSESFSIPVDIGNTSTSFITMTDGANTMIIASRTIMET